MVTFITYKYALKKVRNKYQINGLDDGADCGL